MTFSVLLTSKLFKFVGQYNRLLSLSFKFVTFCWGWTLYNRPKCLTTRTLCSYGLMRHFFLYTIETDKNWGNGASTAVG